MELKLFILNNLSPLINSSHSEFISLLCFSLTPSSLVCHLKMHYSVLDKLT